MPTTEISSRPDDSTHEFVALAPSPPREVRVAFGGLTDRGKARENNEDQFLIARLLKAMQVFRSSLPEDGKTRLAGEEGFLMIVADGMGGVAAGERASALAVATVEEFILNAFHWFLHLGEREENALLTELRHALERADRTVIERARQDPRLMGMGTTLTMAYSVGADLFVVHAGDTRAYLFREGVLEQLTTDHTVAQKLVESGLMTAEKARQSTRRNVLTNVIGGPDPGVSAEIHKLVLRDGDWLMLCSDGLTGPVGDDQIAQVLAEADDPETACRRLVDRALNAGGRDNVTVLAARYGIE